MGKLKKTDLARLITLTAALYQLAAAIQGFIWPKILWDFATKSLDVLITPFPLLQTANLLCAVSVFAWEWPLNCLARLRIHRSAKARVITLLLVALPAILLYQSTNAALYYIIASAMYYWARSEGEVVAMQPWTRPNAAAS
ncbi:hypothetical protein F5Y06DRAFT_305436 [Hypoxylon sp. FL0890]|nr:hypothetical protein F5Y06DRAFT_305436 [Hypoxylon sp. FL0890]